MSQDETTKYKMNQQQQQQQHYQQYWPQGSNGWKYENVHRSLTMSEYNDKNNADIEDDNRTLYENYLVKRDNIGYYEYNKNVKLAIDAKPNNEIGVNNKYRFVVNGTTVVNGAALPLEVNYENLEFKRDLQLDKKILLQKYFRTALVGPRENIYENLCRGCNYGVFSARGPLCSFCECIVNGVTSIEASPAESSNNIYENICAHCAQFYSGNGGDEDECPCRKKVTFREVEKSVESLRELGSSELLLVEELKNKKEKIKVRKSKSFNKSVKPKILSNFWDTWRKPKVTRKPLEIVHHVDGHDQVFHTKETFDLQKICELKRSVTSCSDQHIYGRLKPRELNESKEEFLSTQSLVPTEQRVKKSRISKPKFLRSLSAETKQNGISAGVVVKSQLELDNAQNPQYYLNPSVCLWMTSLRRELLTSSSEFKINTLLLKVADEDNEGVFCYPKSIPGKNLLNLSCKTAPLRRPSHLLSKDSGGKVTNRLNIYECVDENLLKNVSDTDTESSESFSSTEIVALRSHSSKETSTLPEGQGENQQQVVTFPRDHYQHMVDEFILHLQNKQQKYDKMVNNNTTGGMAGARRPKAIQSAETMIPLRQAANTVAASNHNKAKRQGMYLRFGEQNHDYESVVLNTNREQGRNNTNNNENKMLISDNVNNNSNVNCTVMGNAIEKQQNSVVLAQTITSPVAEKRLGMHEHSILKAFEAMLQQEEEKTTCRTVAICSSQSNESLSKQTKQQNKQTQSYLQQPYGVLKDDHVNHKENFTSTNPATLIIVDDLIQQLQLSSSLNRIVLVYDFYLSLFLQRIVFSSHHHQREKCKQKNPKQLGRIFQRFRSHCRKLLMLHSYAQSCDRNSINAKLDLMITNGNTANITATTTALYCEGRELPTNTNNESLFLTNDDDCECNEQEETNVLLATTKPYTTTQTNVLKTETSESSTDTIDPNRKPKKPPEVPKRDPTTKLSPTKEQLPPVPLQRTIMTVPSGNLVPETKTDKSQEESIYQPIWKFKTVGEVQERFKTDADYYDIKGLNENMSCQVPEILISEEDHSEWEPDEEFVFSSKPQKISDEENDSMLDKNATIRSNRSNDSSIITTSSLSGSTITDFASSTATLASCVSTSLMHHLFRNIGIFYSLSEPKFGAIIFDYDRTHSSRYFCKNQDDKNNNNSINNNDSGLGKSPTPKFFKKEILQPVKESSNDKIQSSSESIKTSCPVPQSVEAWKKQLLSVNYMEDEEDMIVSESELLRVPTIKEDVEPPLQTQPQIFKQRFKSLSTDNILDLPLEDGDKRSFGDRVLDKLVQRGILNINNRSSPKSEKRLNKALRNAQTTSLYSEEGINPKYPIFAAPLYELELNQTTWPNVPRFVVDSIEYIERKDRINQDGLYRACGNKFSIDELKHKLGKSYIYDPKLIAADDIHTIASLLKQFFRDLPQPLIPQETYNCLARDLTINEGVDAMRIAINEMPEPNKSTLGFLIKHLTNVAACSCSNRMTASNLAIVWGPSLFTLNEAKTYDIGRMNTLAKVLIENYNRIFQTNERLL